jgi:hypothetical protein
MRVWCKALHWQPVRSTKKIASMAARSSTRGLWQPRGCLGRGGSSSSNLAHSSSGKRQPSSGTHRFGALTSALSLIPRRSGPKPNLPTGIAS